MLLAVIPSNEYPSSSMMAPGSTVTKKVLSGEKSFVGSTVSCEVPNPLTLLLLTLIDSTIAPPDASRMTMFPEPA